MDPVLLAVLFVSGIGLVLGLGLAIVSKIMAVPVDEREELITETLPGANCGACGFSGCSGYAAALASGAATQTNLCAPGGSKVSKEIAGIMGLEAGEVIPTCAVVLCQGNVNNAQSKMVYSGVKSCAMAQQLFGGAKTCVYGCLGLGDCMDACEFDAIHICDGVARINPLVCRSCKACVKACPKGLIELMPLHVSKAAVLCKNHDKGVVARKECKKACIGCMKCEKVCEYGAVKVDRFAAYVDTSKCVGCGKCRESCPVGCIEVITPGHAVV